MYLLRFYSIFVTMWNYNGIEIYNKESLPEGVYGFIYEIINETKLSKGELPYKYIGKKNIYSQIKKPLGKKELATLTDKRKSKKKLIVKESDWFSYTGSCDSLNEDIKNGDVISKNIILLCFCKTNLTYSEIKLQFTKGVLESDEYYNTSINNMWYKGNLFCKKENND